MNNGQSNQPVEGLPTFWTRVQGARRRFLALDYDGTLAPFRIERMKAKPVPGTVALLGKIAKSRDTRLAVVSGRPIVELAKLLESLPIEMVGAHGFELRNREGEIRRISPDQRQEEGLSAAFLRAREASFGSKVERKNASLAFHSRGTLDDADRNELAKCLWMPVAAEYGLELRDFNGGVEIRATGTNKGAALLELLQTEQDNTLIVYIGDDDTDEDAFEAIGGRGIGIKVGGYGLKTAAMGRLPHCEAVQNFLRTWLRVAGGG